MVVEIASPIIVPPMTSQEDRDDFWTAHYESEAKKKELEDAYNALQEAISDCK